MKRTIEIEDTLQERVESVCEEVEEALKRYLEDHNWADVDEFPCLCNDLNYSGQIHEIIDSSVPIYTGDIGDLWYLYSDQFERAFENAGIGDRNDDWPSSWEAAAIYCYLEAEVAEWYEENVEDICMEWAKGKEKEEE